ncbi:SurA N-terminal domain-containing protein [Luteibacter aegosomatissinici]|uniref:SurA N-terminal domain-containing protein n=1 Tax=Luteibacter aegosomatissinici TaxID=2911539 RepID=UPI001FFBFA5B|nr:SurA N-terminal domain-containing protein [Luteibacter aegosomatissinici]UPG93129.1 SurA N-terminal domain-containing protein [Luteibacter aegosomatissinici]
MLQALRNKIHGWPAAIVLGICVFAVAFFGIESYFVSHTDTFVAKVDDHEISQQDWQARLTELRQQIAATPNAPYTVADLEKPELKQQILEGMINQVLLQKANTDLGLTVSNEAVRDTIGADPGFQVDGRFDGSAYRAVLASQGMTPAMYEAKIRSGLATQMVPEAISATTLVSDADVDNFFRLHEQQRDLRFVVLPRPSLADANVADSDIETYYKAHPADFTTPEQVSVQYLEVKQADLKVGEPTDEQLHEYYDKFKQRYAQPEQRMASHILVNVPKNATPDQQKAALEKAKKLAAEATPENFAKLAAENSDDLGSKRGGGDLGWLEKGVTNPAFDAALFAMKKGEVSKEPVLSPDEGYHIIWLRDAREGDAKPFAEVRGQLASDWAKAEGERLYNEKAGQLADLAERNPGSLEPAAKELGLDIKTSPLFGHNGGEGIPQDPKFIQAAFADDVLNQGNNSSLVQVGKGDAIVMHLAKHNAAAPKDLATVKDVIRQRILDERVDALAKKQADELVAQVAKGGDVATLAKTPVQSAAGLTRNKLGDVKDVPPGILREVFSLARPADGKAVWSAVRVDNGSYAVVTVDKVTDGDPSKVEKATRDALRGQMMDAMARAVTMEYIESLRARAKITVASDRM